MQKLGPHERVFGRCFLRNHSFHDSIALSFAAAPISQAPYVPTRRGGGGGGYLVEMCARLSLPINSSPLSILRSSQEHTPTMFREFTVRITTQRVGDSRTHRIRPCCLVAFGLACFVAVYASRVVAPSRAASPRGGSANPSSSRPACAAHSLDRATRARRAS